MLVEHRILQYSLYTGVEIQPANLTVLMELCTIYSLVLKGTNILSEDQVLSFVSTASTNEKKNNVATAQSVAFKHADIKEINGRSFNYRVLNI